MLLRARRLVRPRIFISRGPRSQFRSLVTLAIETSCDDTAVAVLETSRAPIENGAISHESRSKNAGTSPSAPTVKARLLFNERITANNVRYRGVHPLVALESHQRNLASLVQKSIAAVSKLDARQDKDLQPWTPDLIAVTRGPGMRSNLATGIDFAKGLSVAWGKPMVGVHHMQAHLLTPRLVAALENDSYGGTDLKLSGNLEFPFLSLLVSGGHTMLLLSKSLNNHELLADTDLPLGQALDKLAKLMLPQHVLEAADSTMYGAALEKFVFPDSSSQDHSYTPPANRSGAYYNPSGSAADTWPWSLPVPLADADGGVKRRSLEYSFSGTVSAVERIMRYDPSSSVAGRASRTREVSLDERKALALEGMRVCFEHLTSRVLLALDSIKEPIRTVVVSGGVASNHYLRSILTGWLKTFGYQDIAINCPPPKYCTDNAAMIAWAGVEMYEAGWRSDLGFTARRKWALGQHANGPPIDAKGQGEDDAIGILDVDGWYNVQNNATGDVRGARPWVDPTT